MWFDYEYSLKGKAKAIHASKAKNRIHLPLLIGRQSLSGIITGKWFKWNNYKCTVVKREKKRSKTLNERSRQTSKEWL